MIKQTLYFGNPAYLSLKDRQMVIKLPELEKCKNVSKAFKQDFIRTKPIEDIGIVVLCHRQITITSGLLEALVANNCAIINCDAKGMPIGLVMPLCGNTLQTERFNVQIDATIPLKKQLWQQTIKAKINNQASLLYSATGVEIGNMISWARDVRSGDPDNFESRAAVYYWKNIFPSIPNFTRNYDGVAPNNILNFGYAILRAVVARSLVATGLLPTLGIHHHNKYNAYCLADDIMEPYRPYVDELVIKIMSTTKNCDELTTEIKSMLLSIPTIDVVINGVKRPLMVAVAQTTSSLYRCFNGDIRKISYPIRLG